MAARRIEAPDSYYAFNRETGKLTRMFDSNPDILRFRRALKKPVAIKTRRGLEMVSYLTIPPGVEPKKLPLVLLIHGGPWDRDDDSYDPEVQFLANRGYAVLQANYRGSTGFGIDFLNAGNQRWVSGQRRIYLTPRNGRSITASLIRNESPPWVGRWVATPHCAHWK